MCDCVASSHTIHPCRDIAIGKLGFTRPCSTPTRIPTFANASSPHTKRVVRIRAVANARESKIPAKSIPDLGVLGSEDGDFSSELGFKEEGERCLGFETGRFEEPKRNGGSSGVDFVESEDGKRGERERSLDDYDDLVRVRKGSRKEESESESVQLNGRRDLRSLKQVMRRSSVIAKQAISMDSALSMGFVSQLWVDTNTWAVLVVEVRPNLLSGESERFLLEDVIKVGDVLLIHDESILDYDFKMVGLETLVGYNVVTPSQRNIGKVRGYDFNVNTGAVEALELDSFGFAIIPSSLVNTYALLVEDVLEVVSDAVIVHEAAASRLRRLTKGFWNTQNIGSSPDFGKYVDFQPQVFGSNHSRSTKRNIGSLRYRTERREIEDEWERPMDYL